MEVPSLLTALNNTTDESYLGTDSFIVPTRTQGPSHKWKTSVGNRVTIIQEETSSVVWKHVPSQSNPADLISKGIEPSTLPHHGGRDHTGHHRSIKLAYDRGHNYNRQPGNQMYMLHFYKI